MLGPRTLALVSAALLIACSGCFNTRPSDGGGEARVAGDRQADPSDVALPPGYRIERVAAGLTFPTGVAFDDAGRPHVVEAGYSYGEVVTTPRLLRVEPGGSTVTVATGEDNGPWSGVAFHGGAFYVAEGGVMRGGRILQVSPDGVVMPLVADLPSTGDHHTNGPVIGPDGYLYFGVGTATNSGVVGTDNFDYGWLERHPRFHDIPARDVKLAGRNFTTPDPLTPDPKDTVTTGAYVPFGTPTTPGQVVKGRLPCNGAVMRIPVGPRPAPGEAGCCGKPAAAMDGSAVELVAWGLRNPWGFAFAPDGRLLVTENSYDVRGSRPVWGTGDVLWAIDPRSPGTWYGWPDFFAGDPLPGKPDHFRPPGKDAPQFLLAEHPNPPPKPAAKLGVHSSSNGLDVSRSDAFGFAGEAFVAQFGDMAPAVGKVMAPVGFKVVRVDPRTGVVRDFAANRGKANGPASKLKTRGLERPTACRFDPSGRALYVVDFGVLTVDEDGKPHPRPGTGVLWKITRTDGAPTPVAREGLVEAQTAGSAARDQRVVTN